MGRRRGCRRVEMGKKNVEIREKRKGKKETSPKSPRPFFKGSRKKRKKKLENKKRCIKKRDGNEKKKVNPEDSQSEDEVEGKKNN